MLPERLLERIEKYHTSFPAKLSDYKFIYNKKSKDGTAKANIEPNQGIDVQGVCFEIDEDDFDILNKYEGGYDRRNIIVITTEGSETKAVTYISNSIDNNLVPSNEYKSLVLNGAKHWKLDEAYISKYLAKNA